jgi:hypothetical protein
MHGRHNYPFHKEKSDLDIELEDGRYEVLISSSYIKLTCIIIKKYNQILLFIYQVWTYWIQINLAS